jgi:hypothetical protein
MPDSATAVHLKPAGTPTRLDELRAEIDCEHAAAVAAFRTSVAHAIRAGELLLEAKALVGHGHWLNWVDANFPASRRTAENYMKLAKHPQDSQRVAHLGVGRAVRALGVGDLPETDASEVAQELGLDEEWQAFVQCAAAFREIRDRALYRVATAHPTFADYVALRWGLDPQTTKSHMTLAEKRARLGVIGDRDLATCEEIIRPRLRAFDYVGDWFERRLRPPRREMPRQLALCGLPSTGKTYARWGRVSYPPTAWGWQSPATDPICKAIGDALVVGEIVDAAIAGADPAVRRLMERDRRKLMTEVQVRVDAAMRATLWVEPDPRLTAEPDPS